MILLIFPPISPIRSTGFPLSADIEYHITFKLGEGGSVLVKAKTYTYDSNVMRFVLEPSILSSIKIVDASSQLTLNRKSGVIEIHPRGDVIWFRYSFPKVVWYYVLGENKRILCAEVSRDLVQLHLELLLPQPNYRLGRGDAILTVAGIPDDWFIVLTYDLKDGNKFYFSHAEELFSTGFQAARLNYLSEYHGKKVDLYMPLFRGLLGNETFRVNFFLNGAWDVKGIMDFKTRSLGKGLERIAEVMNLPALSPAFIYPARENNNCPSSDCQRFINDMRLPSYVMFHDNEYIRWGHFFDHFIMPYTRSRRFSIESVEPSDSFWEKAVRMYLGYKVASEIANDTSILDSILISSYIADNRLRNALGNRLSLKGYKDYVNDIYAPLYSFYLDQIIRNLSKDKYDLFDVIGEALLRNEWRVATTDDIVDVARERGIDIAPYIKEIKDLKINQDYLRNILSKEGHWKGFYRYLDNFGENITFAPRTLILSYFDYIIFSNKCDHMEDLYNLATLCYWDFLDKLYPMLKGKSITKKTFLDALNRLTNGHSNDFFEFYTKYGLKPSISEIQAFFNGTYLHILGKIIAAKNIIRQMPDQSLMKLVQRTYDNFRNQRYKDALKDIDETLSNISKIKSLDSDNDGLPDWMEIKYGLNPHDPDTDNDGIHDAEELLSGKIIIDGDLSDWKINKHLVLNKTVSDGIDMNVYPGNSIKSIAIAYDENYLYLALSAKDIPFSIQNGYILTIDLDADWSTDTDRIDIPINTIPSSLMTEIMQGNIFLGDVLELRIPIYALRLLGLKNRFIADFGGRCRGKIGLPLDVESIKPYWVQGISINVDLTNLSKLTDYEKIKTQMEIPRNEDFKFLAERGIVYVERGKETSLRVNLSSDKGSTEKIHLFYSGPNWIEVTFNPRDYVPNFTSIVTFKVARNAPLGSYKLNLIAKRGNISKNLTIEITIIEKSSKMKTSTQKKSGESKNIKSVTGRSASRYSKSQQATSLYPTTKNEIKSSERAYLILGLTLLASILIITLLLRQKAKRK